MPTDKILIIIIVIIITIIIIIIDVFMLLHPMFSQAEV